MTKNVAILSTGNELLYGKTLDTNSAFISARLFTMDLRVRKILVVGDDIDDLSKALRHAIAENDVVIITGGLGPTDDDNTIEALQRVIEFPIIVDEGSRTRMEAFFRSINMPMSEKDLKMAEVPSGAMVLPNGNGLAPGFVLRHKGTVIIAMPGVPGEARAMTDGSVIPFLRDEFGIKARHSFSFMAIGMKESDINAAVKGMGAPLDQLVWGMTAQDGMTTVTFVARDGPFDFAPIADSARRLFGSRFLDPQWTRPEEEIIHLLRTKGLTLAFAESCTGGLLAKRITDVAGSSDIFTGAVVAYDNGVKNKILGVSDEKLAKFGAVSPEVAADMAQGVRLSLGSSIGMSTTGIAGPGGGSDAKPVGTVWFGFTDGTGVRTFSSHIDGSRDRVRTIASLYAIEYLRSYLAELPSGL